MSDASPPDELYLVETAVLVNLMRALAAKIDDTRGRTAVERWALLDEIGYFAEWQITGWYGTLAQTRFRDLK